MSDRFRTVSPWAVPELPDVGETSAQVELRHFRRVNSSLLRGALEKWAEVWGEFEDRLTSGVMVLPDAQKGFKPQCGWPEFLEKMWQLKFYLDSAKRFCDRGT